MTAKRQVPESLTRPWVLQCHTVIHTRGLLIPAFIPRFNLRCPPVRLGIPERSGGTASKHIMLCITHQPTVYTTQKTGRRGRLSKHSRPEGGFPPWHAYQAECVCPRDWAGPREVFKSRPETATPRRTGRGAHCPRDDRQLTHSVAQSGTFSCLSSARLPQG